MLRSIFFLPILKILFREVLTKNDNIDDQNRRQWVRRWDGNEISNKGN